MKGKKYKEIPCIWYKLSTFTGRWLWLTHKTPSPTQTEQGYLNMTLLELFKELINSFVGSIQIRSIFIVLASGLDSRKAVKPA